MRRIKIIAVLVCIVLLFVISLQNRAPVETSILMATVTMPQVILLLTTTVLGFIAGFVVRSLLIRGP